ncbi:MAG: hypothetical protein ACREF3_07220 [Acetobacteraceae bacterium]
MTAPPREKTLRHHIVGCSMAVLVAANSAAAFAHGGSQHRGGGNSGDGGSIAPDGDHFHSLSHMGFLRSRAFTVVWVRSSRHLFSISMV